MNIASGSLSSPDAEYKEVFCAYGQAVYEASGVEKAMVQLFATSVLDPSNPESTVNFREMIREKDELTLGTLIKDARKKNLDLPRKIDEQIDGVLNERNQLIHNFYFDAYDKIIDTGSRKELIKSLDALTKKFGDLNGLIIDEVVKRVKDKGVPQSTLDQLAKEVMTELKG